MKCNVIEIPHCDLRKAIRYEPKEFIFGRNLDRLQTNTRKDLGVSVHWCPLYADPSLSSPLLSSPRLAPAAACCSRPALSASEPAGSWREKKPSREKCVFVFAGGLKLETERIRRTLEHSPRVVGTFGISERVYGEAESCAVVS